MDTSERHLLQFNQMILDVACIPSFPGTKFGGANDRNAFGC